MNLESQIYSGFQNSLGIFSIQDQSCVPLGTTLHYGCVYVWFGMYTLNYWVKESSHSHINLQLSEYTTYIPIFSELHQLNLREEGYLYLKVRVIEFPPCEVGLHFHCRSLLETFSDAQWSTQG